MVLYRVELQSGGNSKVTLFVDGSSSRLYLRSKDTCRKDAVVHTGLHKKTNISGRDSSTSRAQPQAVDRVSELLQGFSLHTLRQAWVEGSGVVGHKEQPLAGSPT
jgi:hypothetical protein